jgi:chemotaxis protein methyltransferase CheR
MRDDDCICFLQWALPQLDMHWPGFRKVRHQVCKRVKRRIDALALNGFASYRQRLQADPQEWRILDHCCHITISRFFRDRAVFEDLRGSIVPAVAERARSERRQACCWSAGCASGEEPYSLRILWSLAVKDASDPPSIVATDVEEALLGRARDGCYGRTSLRELPPELTSQAFVRDGSRFCVRPQYREGVKFLKQDLRSEAPPGPFDIVLCRNIAFTYFVPLLRQKVLAIIADSLIANGFLVVGTHEEIDDPRFVTTSRMPHIFTKVS